MCLNLINQNYLTLSSNKSKEQGINPSDWISQAEAARIRNVSRQAIHDLVQRGRLTSLSIGGRTLVNLDEVESFERQEGGRPSSEADE